MNKIRLRGGGAEAVVRAEGASAGDPESAEHGSSVADSPSAAAQDAAHGSSVPDSASAADSPGFAANPDVAAVRSAADGASAAAQSAADGASAADSPGFAANPDVAAVRSAADGASAAAQSAADAQIAAVFSALADPARRQVVQLLGAAPRRAGELAAAVGMTPPAMSRHLRVLLQAGIVTDERATHDARLRYFRLRPQSMIALQAWLDQLKAHWDEQLAAFKRHVEEKHS